jgi:hypothetical protein
VNSITDNVQPHLYEDDQNDADSQQKKPHEQASNAQQNSYLKMFYCHGAVQPANQLAAIDSFLTATVLLVSQYLQVKEY